ncbi:MAG: tryptophan synthase subunit alpha [Promethearchaeia archaeon]
MSNLRTKNRLINLFEEQPKKKGVFMPFLVTGDPNPEQFLNNVRKIESYFDILELGIPFSDPIADGPTVQKANHRAFQAGMNTTKGLALIKSVREITKKPIVILTYYNILIQGGESIEDSLNRTLCSFKECGVDGIVVADLPVEEAGLALKYCKKYDIKLIFIVAPTTTKARLEKILDHAEGFLYLISVMGVTGAREKVAKITTDTIHKIKSDMKKDLPILVGFGISKPEHANTLIEAGADGVIIGSAIINRIEKNLGDYEKMEQQLVDFVSGIGKRL